MGEIELNIGPVHPATHGVLRLKARVEKDTVLGGDVEIGYLHRAMEKIAEQRLFNSFFPNVDKLEYVSALNWEILYASVLEKALGIDIPPRAKYIRVILAEIQRIMSHLIFIGAFGQDLGNITVFTWALRERELLMDIVEKISGGRLAPMYLRVGGTEYDLPEGFDSMILPVLDRLEEKVNKDYKAVTYENSLFKMRTKGVGVLTRDTVKKYGITGPNMRASGIERDLRRSEPYFVYDSLDFDIPVEDAGDSYARFMVRIREIQESIKILRQAVRALPKGNYINKQPWMFKIPPTEAFVRQECPRGEGAMFLVTDGGMKAYRLKIRSPSFYTVQAMPEIIKGARVADLFTIIASLDPVMGEVDR